jgi:hypothetical protein
LSVFRAPYAAKCLATHFSRFGENAVWVCKGLWLARQPRPKHSPERPDGPDREPGKTVSLTPRGFPLVVSAFEGNKAETKTMLPVIEVFMAEHDLPDVTVRPQPESDSSRSRNIEADPAASSLSGGQGVLPVLAVEAALGSHATSGLMLRARDESVR